MMHKQVLADCNEQW